jgi:hypothetical protein
VPSGKSARACGRIVYESAMTRDGHDLRWMVAGSLKNVCEPEMRVVWTRRETIMGGIMSTITIVPLVHGVSG